MKKLRKLTKKSCKHKIKIIPRRACTVDVTNDPSSLCKFVAKVDETIFSLQNIF